MNVEKDILNKIDFEDIINKLGARRPVFGSSGVFREGPIGARPPPLARVVHIIIV